MKIDKRIVRKVLKTYGETLSELYSEGLSLDDITREDMVEEVKRKIEEET